MFEDRAHRTVVSVPNEVCCVLQEPFADNMAHSALVQSTLLKSISVGTGGLQKTTLSKHGSVSTPTKASATLPHM